MDIPAILTHLRPGEAWSLNGDTYDGLVWHEDTPIPTEAELVAAWPAVRDARAWSEVRAERDRLLAACDWTQVADAPMTDERKYVWATYRQALRDVPQNFATPDEVVWPEVP